MPTLSSAEGMAPARKAIDRELVLSVAREVAITEQIPSRTKVWNRCGIVESTGNKAAKRDGWLEELDGLLRRTPSAAPEGRETPGVAHHDDGSATVVSAAEKAVSWTREGLLREHGFDPEEWVVVRARANRWGTPEGPNEQLRVDVVPRAGILELPDPAKWKAPPKPKKRKAQKYLDAFVIGDHHAPFNEPTFHALTLQYLADTQPDMIEVNGDLLDFATISRHRERETFVAGVNECLQGGFEILRDYREVCPNAQIRFKRGNHSERLRHAIIDNIRGLHNIKPAGDEVAALSLRRLLHLDALHIEYIDVEWDQAKTKLSRKLTARHGFSTSKNAGEQMLDKLSGSTVQGHDHRAGLTFRTDYGSEEGDMRVRMAMQAGCACIIPGGLAYVTGGEPNWQNAFGSFRIWPDGDFHGSLGIYVPGRLLAPNGERYTA